MEIASKIAGRIAARITTSICAIALVGAALAMAPTRAAASSHREAPLITEMPKVDGTDWYMFRSYEDGRSDFVTMVANYYPLQDPFGGPNYFLLDPAARYDMKIDNNGDAKPEIVFSFQFTNTRQNLTLPINGKNVAVPLTNIGPIPGMSGNLNVAETYTVKVLRPGQPTEFITNASGGSKVFTKPTDNIGCKSFGDASTGTNCLNDDSTPGASYDTYAKQFIYNVNIPGCAGEGRLFVGQRKDPFVVNLGETFDLINYAASGGRGVREYATQQHRRQKRYFVDSRSADKLSRHQQDSDNRRLDRGEPASDSNPERVRTSKMTSRTWRMVISGRSRDWVCRWLMNW